ncbi:hypothetical protein POM88_036299 [Heracleum sosnowskyi]|uniref:Uncharacterized protein n=1 Tax=Heracleum sosnowskyi TaxID=360622 RepID=A0AAD8HMW9_9APIA|nr:hypothetical protein POM88_036299 [Heracleum sosnowskyi]
MKSSSTMISQPVSITDFLIVNKDVKDIFSLEYWELEYDVIVEEKFSVSSKVAEAVNEAEMNSSKKPEDRKKPIDSWSKSKYNTYVLVNEFSVNVTYDEIVKEPFKCGVVKEIHERRNPVSFGLQLLSEAPRRPGGNNCMSITKAKFKHIKENTVLNQVNNVKVLKIGRDEHKTLG